MKRTIQAACCVAALLSTPSFADDAMIVIPDSAAAKWIPGPASLPKGVQISMLQGDPSKPGPFVLRLKVPANTVIAPHTHSKPETVTVLSGDLYHEMGKTIDKSAGKELHAGGFVYLPQDMPHSLWNVGPVEIQVSGSGPFGVNYINPADDPGKKS